MADASTDDTAAKWEREPNVVWRLGPDRVLVRRVGGDGLELIGAVAFDRSSAVVAKVGVFNGQISIRTYGRTWGSPT